MRSARWIFLGAALAAGACTVGAVPPEVDADGDGVAAGYDCDDSNPAVSRRVDAFRDVDRDGVGAGASSTFCTAGAAPSGYALQGADCAPVDPTAWRTVDLVDRDGDGFTVKETAPTCIGATVPEPFRTTAAGNDCDEADPAAFAWTVLYRDQDGDGVGVRPRSIRCLGATIPSGWSRLGGDVDDADPAVARDPAADDLAALFD